MSEARKSTPKGKHLNMDGGVYVRTIGQQDGKPKRFRLGKDLRLAIARELELLNLWDNLRAVGGQDWSDRPSVDPNHVPSPVSSSNFSFGAADLKLGDWLGQAEAIASGQPVTAPADAVLPPADTRKRLGVKLVAAMTEYADFLKRYHVTPGTTDTNESGFRKAALVAMIAERATDCDLADLDFHRITEIVGYWRNRPPHKTTGKPLSISTCSRAAKEFKAFLNWLDSASYGWEQPRRMEAIFRAARTKRIPTDDERTLAGVPTFTVPELTTIWKYATPQLRAYILLGLNCGYSWSELKHFNMTTANLETGRIRSLRHKTGTLADHALFSESIELLKRYGNKPLPFEGVYSLTKKGNRQNAGANIWNRIMRHIENDHKGFRKLPFKMLRKTGCK